MPSCNLNCSEERKKITEEINNDISSPLAILSTYCYFLGVDQGLAHKSPNFLTSLLGERSKKKKKKKNLKFRKFIKRIYIEKKCIRTPKVQNKIFKYLNTLIK